MNDSNPEARQKAASQLGETRDARAVAPLSALLRDPDPRVRAAAASALGTIKDARAVDPLISALEDENAFARQRAAAALGQIGDKRASERLLQTLQDSDDTVRAGAAGALGNLKDERGFEPLLALLETDNSSFVRHAAAWALGQLRDARAGDALLAALRDRNVSVRSAAAGALGEIKEARAVEPLIACLSDDEVPVRRAAVKALANIGDPRATAAFRLALNDSDSRVKESAAWALKKLESPPPTRPVDLPATGRGPSVGLIFGVFACVQVLVVGIVLWLKRRQLRDRPSPAEWRIAAIEYRQNNRAAWKENWEASATGMLMCLAGFGLFVAGLVSVFAEVKPVGRALTIMAVAWPVGALGLLMVNRARRRGWLRIEADCLDREHKRVRGHNGSTWAFHLLCKFKLDGKEYSVTPFYYSTFATERRLLRFLDRAITSRQTCYLWVNPRNPLETELSVGGLPDFLLH